MRSILVILLASCTLACGDVGETDFAVETIFTAQDCDIRIRSAYSNADISGGSNRIYNEARCGEDATWFQIVRHGRGDRFQVTSFDGSNDRLEYRYCHISFDDRHTYMIPDFSYLENYGVTAELADDTANFCDDWLVRFCAGPNRTSNWGVTVCENSSPRPDYFPTWRN